MSLYTMNRNLFKISSITKFHLTPLTTKQINTGILLVKKPIQNLSATHKNQNHPPM